MYLWDYRGSEEIESVKILILDISKMDFIRGLCNNADSNFVRFFFLKCFFDNLVLI